MSGGLPAIVWLSLVWHAALLLAWVTGGLSWPWLLEGIVADHALIILGILPGSRLLGPDLRRLPPASAARGEVALTFDDGPDPIVTPQVLAMLDRAGARASFFCIAAAARAHPDLLREILRRGHSVENHTDTHPLTLAAHGIGRQRREVRDAQASLADLAGAPPRFLRAPCGLRSPFLGLAMAGQGLTYLTWTRRAGDGLDGRAERGLARLTSRLAAGDILLLHDGRCGRDAAGRPLVLEILPPLLARLAERGLRPVSLPMAMRAAGPGAAGAAPPPPPAGYASR